MTYLGSWKIDDLLTWTVNTHNASTGAATDADAAPAYRVYEDETATPILTGTMALLDSANTDGLYSEQITLSAANGFEKGKSYNIYVSAAVSSVTGTVSRAFQMEAEVDANTVSDGTLANIYSDTTIIVSDTTAIHSDTTIIASDVVLIYSDTAAIHSDTTIIASDVVQIYSDTTIIASDLVLVYSDTAAIHSDTTIIHSDTIVISSDTAVIESDVAAIEGDQLLADTTITVTSQTVFTLAAGPSDDDALIGQTIVLQDVTNSNTPSVRRITAYTGATRTVTIDAAPDFTIATSDLAKVYVTSTAIAKTYSDTTIIVSDTTVIESDTTAIHSDTTIIASDVVLVYSDTAAIHSDTTIIASDVVQIYSDTTIIASDLVLVYSDTTVIASDLVLVYSDTTAIHSDTTIIASDVVQIYSDTTIIYSDTTVIASDTAVIEVGAATIVSGTAQTGTLSTTQMTSDLTEATDDHYIGRAIIWTSGVLQNQATDITDYSGTNGLLTFTAVTEAPSNNDTFIIV